MTVLLEDHGLALISIGSAPRRAPDLTLCDRLGAIAAGEPDRGPSEAPRFMALDAQADIAAADSPLGGRRSALAIAAP